MDCHLFTARGSEPHARRRGPGRHGPCDEGAAAVEFALVVPMLVMLVFGIITFGFAFAQLQSLNNASRQMARVGVVGQNTCGTMLSQASAADTIGLRYPLTVQVVRAGTSVCTLTVDSTGTATAGDTSAVACPSTTASTTSSLTVTTSAPVRIQVPLIGSWDRILTGKGVFQCEIT